MVKQAVRQNHTDNHTRVRKRLCNGTDLQVTVVQILSLRPAFRSAVGLTEPFVSFTFVRRSDLFIVYSFTGRI